jgi:hypothetical protein
MLDSDFQFATQPTTATFVNKKEFGNKACFLFMQQNIYFKWNNSDKPKLYGVLLRNSGTYYENLEAFTSTIRKFKALSLFGLDTNKNANKSHAMDM